MPHRFCVPQVHEIVQAPKVVPPAPERPVTQRELVAASLLLCPPVASSKTA
jgi:hypothetical protein